MLCLFSDVTTSPDQPPQFRALERERFNLNRDMKYPPALAERQKRGYPKLLPLMSDLTPGQVFELVQSAALEMPRWEIVAVESGRLQLEATAAVAWAGLSFLQVFREDIVIQVRAESAGASVHARCKARLGSGLLGMQARMIRRFLRKLQTKLA